MNDKPQQSSEIQKLYKFKDLSISNVISGKNHIAMISNKGELYMMGSNEYGQLGFDQQDLAEHPILLASLFYKGLIIEQVACGFKHTLALSKNGKVFSWGQGKFGELGHDNFESRTSPLEIQYFTSIYQTSDEIDSIQCGAHHSGLLDKKGNLYMWGAGEVGQLGTSNRQNEFSPQLINKIKLDYGEKIKELALGYFHSLILTELGRVMQTGISALQLQNDNNIFTTFSELPCLKNHQQIAQIKAKELSVALTLDGRLLLWSTIYHCERIGEGQSDLDGLRHSFGEKQQQQPSIISPSMVVQDYEMSKDFIIIFSDSKFFKYNLNTKSLEAFNEAQGDRFSLNISSLSILSCGHAFLIGVQNKYQKLLMSNLDIRHGNVLTEQNKSSSQQIMGQKKCQSLSRNYQNEGYTDIQSQQSRSMGGDKSTQIRKISTNGSNAGHSRSLSNGEFLYNQSQYTNIQDCNSHQASNITSNSKLSNQGHNLSLVLNSQNQLKSAYDSKSRNTQLLRCQSKKENQNLSSIDQSSIIRSIGSPDKNFLRHQQYLCISKTYDYTNSIAYGDNNSFIVSADEARCELGSTSTQIVRKDENNQGVLTPEQTAHMNKERSTSQSEERSSHKDKMKEALRKEIRQRLTLEKQLKEIQQEFEHFKQNVGVDQTKKLLNESKTEYQNLYEICIQECEKANKYLELYKKERNLKEERENQIMQYSDQEELLKNQIRHLDQQLSMLRDEKENEYAQQLQAINQQRVKQLQQILKLRCFGTLSKYHASALNLLYLLNLIPSLDFPHLHFFVTNVLLLQDLKNPHRFSQTLLKSQLSDLELSNYKLREDLSSMENHFKEQILLEEQIQQSLANQNSELKVQMQQLQSESLNGQRAVIEYQREHERTRLEVQSLQQILQLKQQSAKEYDQIFAKMRVKEEEHKIMIQKLESQIEKYASLYGQQSAPQSQQTSTFIPLNLKDKTLHVNKSNSTSNLSSRRVSGGNTARQENKVFKPLNQNSKSPATMMRQQILQKLGTTGKSQTQMPEQLKQGSLSQQSELQLIGGQDQSIKKLIQDEQSVNGIVSTINYAFQANPQHLKTSRSNSPIDYLGLKPKQNKALPPRNIPSSKLNTNKNSSHQSILSLHNKSRNYGGTICSTNVPSPNLLNLHSLTQDHTTLNQIPLSMIPSVLQNSKEINVCQTAQTLTNMNVTLIDNQSMFDSLVIDSKQGFESGSSSRNGESFGNSQTLSKSFDNTNCRVNKLSKKHVQFMIDHRLQQDKMETSFSISIDAIQPKNEEKTETDKTLEGLAAEVKSSKSNCEKNSDNLKEKLETIRRNKMLLEDKIKEYERKLGK